MNHSELRTKVSEYIQAGLKEARAKMNAEGPMTPTQHERYKESRMLWEMPNEEFWQLVGKDNATKEYVDFCQATGLDQNQSAETKWRILDELRKAKVGAFKAMAEHSQSLDTYDFTEPLSASGTASDAIASHSPRTTLGETVEAFLTVHGQAEGWTHGTIQKRRAMLDVALEWFGPDADMAEIGKKEVAAFKNEVLLKLPVNRSKAELTRGLPLREAIKVPGVAKINSATVNSYLSTYKNLWAWAEAHGYAQEVLFDGMKVGKKAGTAKNRAPFNQEALAKAYTALTDPDSKYFKKKSHRWATLIAMFSGARLNEVCQLHLSDIKEVEGVWVFDFTDQDNDTKRLKTSAAQRRVPVHSHLIELGLLDFITDRSSRGHARLFPDFTYTEKAGYGDKLSKWFNRTFTPNLDIKSDAHVFHGLRHTFATRLAQADVETERVQFIIGHERQGVTHQVYMREGYTLRQTKDAVERFKVSIETGSAT